MPELINLRIPESIIGPGSIGKLGELLDKFRPDLVLVVTDRHIIKSGIIENIRGLISGGKYSFETYEISEPEPTFGSIMKLATRTRNGSYDLLLGVGGGSVMDAVKVASQLAPEDKTTINELLEKGAAKPPVTKILIPTTSGTGSEWSNVAVIYDDHANNIVDRSRVFVSPQNYADAVIIDPNCSISVPPPVIADTGMDALTHAIEAYTSRKSNTLSDMLASTAIKLVSSNLLQCYHRATGNSEAWYNMSIAASLGMGAVVISGVGMAHIANVPLGQRTGLPHGAACALLLPHVMAFNIDSNPAKYASIATLMGQDTAGLTLAEAGTKAIDAVITLMNSLNMKKNLADSSLTDSDIEAMTEAILSRKGPPVNSSNPRDISPEDIRRIFKHAINGTF